MYEKLSIKNWAVEDRPREKMLSKGIRALSEAELIAILIGSGNAKETAVELSRRILAGVNNNLNELARKSVDDLKKFKGIGEAKAINIMSALELGRRRRESEPEEKLQINGSADVARIFHPLLGDLPHEEFWVLFLNRSNRVIDKQMISQGGLAGTVIDVRIILKAAIEKLASAIILCHNHPSGNLQASDADRSITKKIREAGQWMDIPVLDHVIIGNEKYFSFADEGLI
ncbi:MAG: DNA repair protein RadC [Prolixibacteraceae bacterium]|jgi:DNA repair protein RadC|nr:DNA repair protein RadC [Prolixibacteraceae bacterium]